MLKRINAASLVLALLLSMLCSLCVASAENGPQLTVEINCDQVPAGGKVTAAVKLTGNVGGISGIVLELEYGDRLRLINAKSGSEKLHLEWDKNAQKKVAIAAGEAVTDETVALAYLTFKVDDAAAIGTADITVKTSDATDAENKPLTVGAGTDSVDVTSCQWGDVNGDSETNILDALVILRYLVGRSTADDLNLLAANTDRDSGGEVNVEDARLLIKYEIELVPWDPNNPGTQA